MDKLHINDTQMTVIRDMAGVVVVTVSIHFFC